MYNTSCGHIQSKVQIFEKQRLPGVAEIHVCNKRYSQCAEKTCHPPALCMPRMGGLSGGGCGKANLTT